MTETFLIQKIRNFSIMSRITFFDNIQTTQTQHRNKIGQRGTAWLVELAKTLHASALLSEVGQLDERDKRSL